MKAIWNNEIIAESTETILIENNYYFPKESVNLNYLRKSGNHYTCPWKGTCDYYDILLVGKVNPDAAWVYPNPKPAAKEIANCFAFWKGVEIVEN